MRLDSIKFVVIFGILILAISIVLDIIFIMEIKVEKKYLSNYIAYESTNIKERKKVIFDMIQTDMEFRTERLRGKFERFKNFESQNLLEFEKNILTFFNSNYTSLDSESFKIAEARKLWVNNDHKDIKTIYENLFALSMLDLMSRKINLNTGSALLRWELFRPITEDSVYIGVQYFEDHKTAFRINGKYFDEESTNTYSISKNDTLRIETINMRNRGSTIDTAISAQTIVNLNGIWRKISN